DRGSLRRGCPPSPAGPDLQQPGRTLEFPLYRWGPQRRVKSTRMLYLNSLDRTLEFPAVQGGSGREGSSSRRAVFPRLAPSSWSLRFSFRQLLQLHSATLQDTQKEAALLHAPDQKALLSRVTEEDQKLLECLVPRVRGLTQRSAQGLSYGVQVKTAISYWWDQPAQHVLPEVQKGGMTFQQWLQRWRLAAKAS
ncbi:hypothetical protein KUCAC02_032593, partial [Chaenocephalus aceratus]